MTEEERYLFYFRKFNWIYLKIFNFRNFLKEPRVFKVYKKDGSSMEKYMYMN